MFDEETFSPSAKLTSQGDYSIVSDYLGTPVEAYDENGKKVWCGSKSWIFMGG